MQLHTFPCPERLSAITLGGPEMFADFDPLHQAMVARGYALRALVGPDPCWREQARWELSQGAFLHRTLEVGLSARRGSVCAGYYGPDGLYGYCYVVRRPASVRKEMSRL